MTTVATDHDNIGTDFFGFFNDFDFGWPDFKITIIFWDF